MWGHPGLYSGTTIVSFLHDLRFFLRRSIASIFADNTSITYASKKMKSFETVLNQDLKITSDWLKTNSIPKTLINLN